MSNQPTASVPPYAQSTPGAPSYNDVTRPPPESYRPQTASDANYNHNPPSNGNSLPYRPPPGTTTSTKADPPYSQPIQTSYPPAYPIPSQSTGLTYPGGPPPSAPGSYGPPLSMADQLPRPAHTPLPVATIAKPSLKATLIATESTLREYMNMQRVRRLKTEPGMDERLRIQAATALGDLRSLREEVADMIKAAEKHRWRRFLVGGVMCVPSPPILPVGVANTPSASFIPLVRILFRRPRTQYRDSSTDMSGGATNDTEYAFFKSKSLVARILRSVQRPGLATLTFFVFAVMYVFQNEVTLRIARTVGKRLKRLSSKVERGEEDVNEEDLKMLQGWRWRILMWS